MRLSGVGGEDVEILRFEAGLLHTMEKAKISEGCLVGGHTLPENVHNVLPLALRIALEAPRCAECGAEGPHCSSVGTACDAWRVVRSGHPVRVPVCRVCCTVFQVDENGFFLKPHPALVAVYDAVTKALTKGENRILRLYLGPMTRDIHRVISEAATNPPEQMFHAIIAASWASSGRTYGNNNQMLERKVCFTKALEYASLALNDPGSNPS